MNFRRICNGSQDSGWLDGFFWKTSIRAWNFRMGAFQICIIRKENHLILFSQTLLHWWRPVAWRKIVQGHRVVWSRLCDQRRSDTTIQMPYSLWFLVPQKLLSCHLFCCLSVRWALLLQYKSNCVACKKSCSRQHDVTRKWKLSLKFTKRKTNEVRNCGRKGCDNWKT